MSIQIQARGFDLTESLEAYVKHRIDMALGDRRDSLRAISVKLCDINGPRGGADKRCAVHVALPRRRSVFAQDVQPDMYDAIDRAVRKAAHSVRRKLSKPRARQLRERLRVALVLPEAVGAGR